MEKIKPEGENILNIGHIQIFVKYPIKKIEKINEKYIILLKIPQGVKLGSIASKEQIPYVAIHVIDGKLYATDFWGRKFNIDIENGKLIDVKIVHYKK